MYLISWMIDVAIYWFNSIFKPHNFCRPTIRNKNANIPKTKTSYIRNRKKTEWVVDKVIYLKAMMPSHGYGKIAATFNRLYSDNGESVSKTFVYEKLKVNKYQLAVVKRNIKNPPMFNSY